MKTQGTPVKSSPPRRKGEKLGGPRASSAAVRARMLSTRQRDTPAELRIRRLIHAMGLRYLVDAKPLKDSARRADVVFRGAKVAIFVDGCFWHGCPEHGTWPKTNRQFWRKKILDNKKRDADTNDQLGKRGWLVIRIWEHEDPSPAALRVARTVRERMRTEIVRAKRRAARHEG